MTNPEEVQRTAKRFTVSLPSTNGAMTLTFGPDGITVRLPCDAVLMSYSDWHFIAKVYGKRDPS